MAAPSALVRWLCTQLGCQHFLSGFVDLDKAGYRPCPACGMSAEKVGPA